MSLECPECGVIEACRVAGTIYHCLMCGTLSIVTSTSNMITLQSIAIPKYYEYFKILQEEIKLDESESATKSCLQALRGLHQQ